MLKGLEITEVKWSYVKLQSDVVRFDSYYYSKEFLSDENTITNQSNKSLKELNTSLLSFGAYSLNNFVEYKESGIPFIRGVNMKDGVLDFSDTLYIDETAHKLLWKSEVKPNTILLSMSGTIGDVAIAMPDYKYPMNSNQDIAKITLNGGLNPYYLYTFLRSKYGQNFLKREARGSVQQHVFLSQMENIRVPLLSPDFQQKIESLVKSAHAKLSESKSLYAQAEDTLLCAFGLKDWQPKNKAVSIKTFSDFASSGRLDAEYYQSKYDELFEKLSKFPQIKIKDIINYPVSSGSTPKAGDSEYYSDEKTGIPFLRAVDIIQSRIDINDLMYIKSRVHNGLLKRTQLHKGDVLFSIAGTVGRCGIFDYDFEANINQAIAILRFDESVVKHLYVIQFFNSKIGQLVIEKYARQGLQTNLNLEELSNLPIPILPQEIQKQIAELIQTSFALRQESKQLLESAKLAVEAEIER